MNNDFAVNSFIQISEYEGDTEQTPVQLDIMVNKLTVNMWISWHYELMC
jgi:hypothetical protein